MGIFYDPNSTSSTSQEKTLPTFTVSDNPKPLVMGVPDEPPAKRRRGRPRKNETPDTVSSEEIVRPTDTVQPTYEAYNETNMLLRISIGQLDEIARDTKMELDAIRANRTLKRKQDFIIGMTNNLVSTINAKVAAVREMNSSIAKAKDLDYKREKDMNAMVQAQMQSQNDSKVVMDLYNSMINSPEMSSNPNVLPFSNPGLIGSDIIRASVDTPPQGFNPDNGYLAYLNNMTPERNLMRYEDNPNVKQVVVLDQSTGSQTFQMMDMSTGQVIQNVPVLDQRFMEDTMIDLDKRIAKNKNLNQTYPLIVINEGVMNEY